MVGYMEPCWVGWSKVVVKGRTCFCVVRNFARVAAEFGNTSCLSRDAEVQFGSVLQGILENLEPELDLWEAKGRTVNQN